jgi:type 1 fimbria pilin
MKQPKNWKKENDMKRARIKTILAGLLLNIPLFIPSVWAGSVTVTGRVIENTCTLDKTDTSVTLDTVSARDISKGADTAKKAFTVGLKDCGADATQVDIVTSGEADSDVADAFINAATGGDAASGVALHFYNVNGSTEKLMKPDGSMAGASQPLNASADNVLNFKAAYTGTKEKATAGNFRSVVNFKLNYE